MDALKIFESPWLRPQLLFPKLLMGFCCDRSIVLKCVQNLKFVALPVPEIKWGTLKLWAVTGYVHAAFSPKFYWAFVRMDPVN